MRILAAASVLSVFAFGASGFAQTGGPDFSGRWRLVPPTAAQLAEETLAVTSPDELLVKQTPREMTIEHPSQSGTHPEAGTFHYGSVGFASGDIYRGTSLSGTRGFSYIGTQLMISRSTTYPPDERGVRTTVASGSMWRLETSTRLVIEFGEERAGERPKIATRVYTRVVAPQVRQPDFSGRWRLVEPNAAERARETLEINAPDELLITQTPLAIIIDHPSKRGSHPESGVFKYGVGGSASGLVGSPSHETRWGVVHAETDLTITHSATHPPDVRGVRTTVEQGSVWRLARSDRLVIEFSESRTGGRPRTATRVYARLKE